MDVRNISAANIAETQAEGRAHSPFWTWATNQVRIPLEASQAQLLGLPGGGWNLSELRWVKGGGSVYWIVCRTDTMFASGLVHDPTAIAILDELISFQDSLDCMQSLANLSP